MTPLRLDLEIPRLAGAQLVALIDDKAATLAPFLSAEPHDVSRAGRKVRVYPLAAPDGFGLELDVPRVGFVVIGRVGLGVEEGQPYIELPRGLSALVRGPIRATLGRFYASDRVVGTARRFCLKLAPGDQAVIPLGPLGEIALRRATSP